MAAYILQVGNFPAGSAELSEAQLASTTFPRVAATAAAAPATATTTGTALIPSVGNLAEVMRAIAFPNANIIFNPQVKDPAAEKALPQPVPFDYVK